MTGLQEKLHHLDELIRDLEERMDTPQGLMREHLTELRSYILGSMPEEYKLTVHLAAEILPQIHPPEMRSRVGEFLHQPYGS